MKKCRDNRAHGSPTTNFSGDIVAKVVEIKEIAS